LLVSWHQASDLTGIPMLILVNGWGTGWFSYEDKIWILPSKSAMANAEAFWLKLKPQFVMPNKFCENVWVVLGLWC